ncbi:hypothetical protein OBBRIDRAFT_284187 [Obba rivulosa]|uniref:Uncharacterized protein n=1 Tax=Obba rivulosa TaxID=1052685 RepID=A0A8E2AJL9_9APHY|nr:hypothetical protein OBBRIDRAFT_284187 [Obba rivulosa]
MTLVLAIPGMHCSRTVDGFLPILRLTAASTMVFCMRARAPKPRSSFHPSLHNNCRIPCSLTETPSDRFAAVLATRNHQVSDSCLLQLSKHPRCHCTGPFFLIWSNSLWRIDRYVHQHGQLALSEASRVAGDSCLVLGHNRAGPDEGAPVWC